MNNKRRPAFLSAIEANPASIGLKNQQPAGASDIRQAWIESK
jgi:hypothetical protein